MPEVIRALLTQSPVLANADFLEGWLERETDLADGRGTASQTDLLALLGLNDGLAVLGVEAKVDESFGKLVGEWLGEGREGRAERLRHLCATLALEPSDVGHLRYQLFHRTAAVLLEARRFRTHNAVLLVHSFCPRASGLSDARAFFDTIGLVGVDSGRLIGPRTFAGVNLWVGWASGEPTIDRHAAQGWDAFFHEPGDPTFPECDQPPMSEERE